MAEEEGGGRCASLRPEYSVKEKQKNRYQQKFSMYHLKFNVSKIRLICLSIQPN
jgi:hypothetical protein